MWQTIRKNFGLNTKEHRQDCFNYVVACLDNIPELTKVSDYRNENAGVNEFYAVIMYEHSSFPEDYIAVGYLYGSSREVFSGGKGDINHPETITIKKFDHNFSYTDSSTSSYITPTISFVSSSSLFYMCFNGPGSEGTFENGSIWFPYGNYTSGIYILLSKTTDVGGKKGSFTLHNQPIITQSTNINTYLMYKDSYNENKNIYGIIANKNILSGGIANFSMLMNGFITDFAGTSTYLTRSDAIYFALFPMSYQVSMIYHIGNDDYWALTPNILIKIT